LGKLIVATVFHNSGNRCIKQALSWQTCKNLDELRKSLKQVLDSISPEAIASICGWQYIVSALLSATS
jgi:putative transposase